MTENSYSLWEAGAEDSRFESGYLPQIGHRLVCWLIFPGVPVGVFFGILAAGGHRALLAAILTLIGLLFACGPVAAALRVIWSLNQSRVDGVMLSYSGTFIETALFLVKISLLTLVTLGFYWLLGFSSVASNKFIYQRTAPAGMTADPGKSGFIGNFLSIIFSRVLITAIPITLMIMTGLIPLRQHSERFAEYVAQSRFAHYDPSMDIWMMLRQVVNGGLSILGLGPLSSGQTHYHTTNFYQESTVLIWTAILLFIASLVLAPWYKHKMMRWETNNAVVNGYQMVYKAKLNDYFLHFFLNGFLCVVTLGLYALLGFNRTSMWKFRVRHTHVFIPASAQAKSESYLVSAETLNRSLKDSVRAVFNPAARRKFANYMRRYWSLYTLLLIPAIYLIIFKYVPMLYIQIGMKINNIVLPIWDVPWGDYYGFQWFVQAFGDRDFLLALRNTIMLNGLDLLFGFPMPIILAILLNELAFRRFKRISQTIFYMPHFLSWVIISALALQLFNPSSGLFNMVLSRMGMSGVDPFHMSFQWVVMFVLLGIWQSAGWGTIIYLAAITNINPELYEAANVDGASRLRKIWHITLPGLRPTIIILLIMRLGSIIGSDFERPYALRNTLISQVSDVISIYIFRVGIQGTKFSLTAAVGIFQSVVGLMFLFAANALAKKFGERGVM
ncbi:MAG: DUF898 family protein [Oscillospiraceae bacterium]|jgi:putative aldouronate transport system permease protein|nr:DUF898 family protein [Oscillospiraceae bacterium]